MVEEFGAVGRDADTVSYTCEVEVKLSGVAENSIAFDRLYSSICYISAKGEHDDGIS